MTLKLRVTALDNEQNRLGICDAWSELAFACVWNGVGSFTLTLPLSSPQTDLWSLDGSIAIHQVDAGGNDIQPALMSGPILDLLTTESDSTNTLAVTGVSDDTYLYDRLIRPDLAGQLTDTRTGPAETVIKGYAATYLRAGDVVIEPDMARGGTVTFAAAYQSVGLVASQLAETGLIGWQIRSTVNPQTGVRQRVLSCRVPSSDVVAVFSKDLGSLSSDTWQLTAATSNRVVLRGGTQVTETTTGTDGTVTTDTVDGPPIYVAFDNLDDQQATGRIVESFTDDSSVYDTAQMATDGQQALTDAASVGSLQATAIDLPGQAFLIAYQLGDMVTAVVDGVPVSDRIRQVQVDIPEGQPQSVVPVIGTYGTESTEVNALVPLVKQLAARLAAVERKA